MLPTPHGFGDDAGSCALGRRSPAEQRVLADLLARRLSELGA